MSNKFLKTYKQEFSKSNCGFDHDPIDSIVRSQWQSRSRSHVYLLYRWALVIFTVVTVIISFEAHIRRFSFGKFFIYLTRWGILMNMIVAIFGAVLVTCWHFHGNFKGMLCIHSILLSYTHIVYACRSEAAVSTY